MGKKNLQCLFIGPKSSLYIDLLRLLSELDVNIDVKQADLKSSHIAYSLKKCRSACLVIISDKVSFSLSKLSDLVWRYSSDAIIVIVTNKTVTTSLKKPFNSTQITKLFLEKESDESSLFLQYIVQYAQLKADFRRCKRLLGISEKRSQRLLDSSKEAIAYTSRDMHLYANTAYLALFEIDSVEELQRTPVQEFIEKDEYELYQGFIRDQLRNHKTDRSLIVSMKKANGLRMRANIHANPAIFKGRKCVQLWVNPINKTFIEQENEKKITGSVSEIDLTTKTKENVKQVVSASSILREIIKREEVSLAVQKLVLMRKSRTSKKHSTDHLLLSLKIENSREKHINNLLSQSEEKPSIFWDKVKLTRLFQILLKKKLDAKLYFDLSEESIKDGGFMEWLIRGVSQLGSKSSNLVFLLPYKLSKNKTDIEFKNIYQLKGANCKIAFDDFKVSSDHLGALKRLKPDYIRLSPAWIKGLEGIDSKEVALGSLVRQFEAKEIKVIAPCGLNKNIKRLFALSGASFCQEKLIKIDQ